MKWKNKPEWSRSNSIKTIVENRKTQLLPDMPVNNHDVHVSSETALVQ